VLCWGAPAARAKVLISHARRVPRRDAVLCRAALRRAAPCPTLRCAAMCAAMCAALCAALCAAVRFAALRKARAAGAPLCSSNFLKIRKALASSWYAVPTSRHVAIAATCAEGGRRQRG
jgi:hypothetical protein